jgi:nuclear pore complex protein Nup155
MSTDEAFHFALYDWFFSTGKGSRLLDIDTPYVLPYLQSNSKTNLEIADMLWVYSQKRGDYATAANVLFSLATSNFEIPLAQRIEFLSRAAGYCNGATSASVRQDLRGLGVRVQDSLDVATIQNDIITALRKDPEFTEEKRAENIAMLDGPLLSVSELYNEFAAPLHYSEICLAIFQTSDHRRTEDITRCWSELVQQHIPEAGADTTTTYLKLSEKVRHLGLQFQNAEFVFPLDYLIPLLETYNYEQTPNAPRGWVIETFLGANATPEALFSVLSDTFERHEPPFSEPAALRLLANDIYYLFYWWSSKARARLSGVMPPAFLEKLRTYLSPEDYQSLVNRVA